MEGGSLWLPSDGRRLDIACPVSPANVSLWTGPLQRCNASISPGVLIEAVQRESGSPTEPVSRFWCHRDKSYALDDSGYLADPHEPGLFGASQNPDAVPTEEFRDARCVVLLGEPGIGKSVEVQRHAPFADPSRCGRVLTVDLGEFSSEDRLVRQVFDSEEINRWQESNATCCITLDGFDEAHSRIPTLARILARYLRSWPQDRMLIRIACRTAEWPASLESELAELFEDLAVYELLPLRRVDVPSLLNQRIDSAAFLGAVDRAGAAPLASRPLTLHFLEDAFLMNGELSENAADLYAQGIKSLCAEVNPSRADAGLAGTLTARQRMHVAARLAAFSTFANKASFKVTATNSDATDEIHIDGCIGASEGTLESAIEVDREAVRETLSTGLFSGRPGGALGWSHATFADFLAASWIVANGLTPQQTRSILVSGSGAIYPQVSSVAAWLVAQAPEAFAWIVDLDPQALLGQIDLPGYDLRERLVEGLLHAAEQQRLVWTWSTNFGSLAHPSLALQVKGRFRDPSRDVRRLVLDIARDCFLAELKSELIDIALDLTAADRDRIEAAWALEGIGQQNAISELASLITQEELRGADPDDELLGVALMASWPHALPTEQVFGLITAPKRRSFIGSYDTFLDRLATSLTSDDLGAALDWLEAQTDLSHHRIAQLANAVVLTAVASIAVPGVRDRLVAYAIRRGSAHLPLLAEDPIIEQPDSPSDRDRRYLLMALAQEVQDVHTLASVVDSLGMYGQGLLRQEDLPWLIDAYADAEVGSRPQLALFVRWTFRWDLSEHRHVVLGLSKEHPLFKDLIEEWVMPIELDSEKARTLGEQWGRLRRGRNRDGDTENPRDAEINALIRGHLDAVEEGEPDRYWQAARLVTVRPGTSRYMEEFQPDLTVQPRWQLLDDTIRNDFVRLAPRYLENGSCQPERWLGKDLRYFPADAGYRALLLLLKLAPNRLDDIATKTWREWTPIIVGWSVTANGARWDDKKRLLQRALPHAREVAVDSLVTLLTAKKDAEIRPFLHDECDAIWCPDLEQEIIKLLDEGTSPQVQDELIHTLARNSAPSSRSRLQWWLSVDNRGSHQDRARSAMAALWQHDPDGSWPTIFRVLQEDPEFGKKFFLRSDVVRLREVPPVSAEAKADLYLWLFTHFPPSEDPAFDDAHMVGPRESVGQARDAILQNLVRLGTEAGVQAVRHIVDALPAETWLKHSEIIAENELTRAQWIPVDPADLLRLASSQRGRLVRSENELLEAVHQALERIQARLQGDTPEAQFLWDTRSATPKAEDEISDYLRNRLQDELGSRGAVVNREVQVRRLRPTGMPERTDIRVDAPGSPNGDTSVMTVAGEVKGPWSDELFTAMSEQLVQKYLSDIGAHHGFFLVVWFDQESWDHADRRWQIASRLARAEIERRLREQSEGLRNRGYEIEVVILDASYRRPEPLDEQS